MGEHKLNGDGRWRDRKPTATAIDQSHAALAEGEAILAQAEQRVTELRALYGATDGRVRAAEARLADFHERMAIQRDALEAFH